jgi:hypothetical protein
MAIPLSANGNTYNYPETGDTVWGDNATNLVSSICAYLSNVGGGASLNPAAIIELNSTTKGFLPSRMTTTQRNAIATPPTGLIVYNTTTNTIDIYNGTAWVGAVTGRVTSASMPAGSVLQVVSTTKLDTFSTTSLTFTDITGLSATITPISTASRILVMVSVSRGVSADDASGFELRRGATSIAIADSGGGIRSSMTAYYSATTAPQLNTLSLAHLDSPVTTLATTYSLRCRQQSGGTLWVNRNNNDSWRAVSSITLMEIAG